jgi:hypothetical protein
MPEILKQATIIEKHQHLLSFLFFIMSPTQKSARESGDEIKECASHFCDLHM